jgi:hypothetical protein
VLDLGEKKTKKIRKIKEEKNLVEIKRRRKVVTMATN